MLALLFCADSTAHAGEAAAARARQRQTSRGIPLVRARQREREEGRLEYIEEGMPATAQNPIDHSSVFHAVHAAERDCLRLAPPALLSLSLSLFSTWFPVFLGGTTPPPHIYPACATILVYVYVYIYTLSLPRHAADAAGQCRETTTITRSLYLPLLYLCAGSRPGRFMVLSRTRARLVLVLAAVVIYQLLLFCPLSSAVVSFFGS